MDMGAPVMGSDQDWLKAIAAFEVWRLEQTLDCLSPRLGAAVHGAITCARAEQRWSASQLDLLEALVKEWHNHNLSTKLAILRVVTGLSGPCPSRRIPAERVALSP